jgi:MFS family permease
MPGIARSLDGLSMYALAFGAPLATSIVGLVMGGSWADVNGPSGPIRVGATAFTVGLLLAGLAATMPMLLIGRAIQGLGVGLLGVALLVVVGRCFPDDVRPRVLAGLAAAWVVPSIVGPAMSGLIVETVGWRWLFLAVAALTPLAAAPMLARLRQPGGNRAITTGIAAAVDGRRLGWAVLTGAAILLLQLAGSSQAGLLTLASVATLAVSGPRLLPRGALRMRRGVPSVITLRGAVAAAFAGAQVFFPLLLVRERGLSPTTAGLLLAAGSIAWSAGSWLSGRVAGTGRRPALLRVGMASVAAGVWTAIVAVAVTGPTSLLLAGWVAVGFGMGIAVPILSLLSLELAAPGEQGSTSSALQVSEALFSALSLAGSGALFATLLHTSSSAPYLAALAVPAAAALFATATAHRVAVHG